MLAFRQNFVKILENSEMFSDKPIQEPKFTLNETQQGNLILKINLPGVESSTDCDLTISQVC